MIPKPKELKGRVVPFEELFSLKLFIDTPIVIPCLADVYVLYKQPLTKGNIQQTVSYYFGEDALANEFYEIDFFDEYILITTTEIYNDLISKTCYPETLSQFITLCEIAGVDLTWREE